MGAWISNTIFFAKTLTQKNCRQFCKFAKTKSYVGHCTKCPVGDSTLAAVVEVSIIFVLRGVTILVVVVEVISTGVFGTSAVSNSTRFVDIVFVTSTSEEPSITWDGVYNSQSHFVETVVKSGTKNRIYFGQISKFLKIKIRQNFIFDQTFDFSATLTFLPRPTCAAYH